MNRVITISREFGCGGREVGIKLAELLGIPFYDKDIISKLASEDFSQAEQETLKESYDAAHGFAGKIRRRCFGTKNRPARVGLKFCFIVWDDRTMVYLLT